MNKQKEDLAKRMATLDPDYRLEETNSSKGVWRLYKIFILLLLASVIILYSLVVIFGGSPGGEAVLFFFWPVILTGWGSAAGVMVTSFLGIFYFRTPQRRASAIIPFFIFAVFMLTRML